jgi:FkbM family methyltransferase
MLYRLNHARLWRRGVRVWGRRARASSLDRLLALWLHRLGVMGTSARRLLEQRVRPGMQVVDVGANVGLYALLLAALAGPGGHVFAFEPGPRLFRALKHNCRRSGLTNLTPLRLALGERPGRARLSCSVFNSGDNRLSGLGRHGAEVEVARLDEVLPGRRVDFIKMDVQGHELHVLRGMEEVLRASPALEIYFELWPAGLRGAGTEPEDLLEHLRQRGFRIYETEQGPLRPVTDFVALGNRLAWPGHVNLLASRAL